MTLDPLVEINTPIVIFSGTFGSGKSEVAVNTAFYAAQKYEKVAIVDLDVVNPYFRCREARAALEEQGIEVIAPGGEYSAADLPIILPQIRGRIMSYDGFLILDVGGDDLGARALASLNDVIIRRDYEYVMVLNERRPYTGSLSAALQTVARIEASAKLKATSIVSNTHLMEYTDVETIVKGVKLAEEVSASLHIPIKFVTSGEAYFDDVAGVVNAYPLMKLERRLPPPWIETGDSAAQAASESRVTGNSNSKSDSDSAALPTPGRPWGKAPVLSIPDK
jgi:hypothetical protein